MARHDDDTMEIFLLKPKRINRESGVPGKSYTVEKGIGKYMCGHGAAADPKTEQGKAAIAAWKAAAKAAADAAKEQAAAKDAA